MEHCCAFTGYREIAPERLKYVKSEIRREVQEPTADGYTDFLCGMARGADLVFASVIAELKAEHKLILEAVLPYPKSAAASDPVMWSVYIPRHISHAASWCAMNSWCKAPAA